MGSTEPGVRERLLSGYTPDYKEAVSIQKELQTQITDKIGYRNIKTIAGADLAILSSEKKLVSGVIVFSYPELDVLERSYAVVDETFPYIPGLLAFREAPAVIEAYGKLSIKPDILIMDGHGIAHPRGFGIACHLGVLLDTPTIGVGKKRLYGTYVEPGVMAGLWSPLVSKTGDTIGAVLRTRDGIKPVFVSTGHKIDLPSSLEVIKICARGYRVPEPTRQADKYVAELKKSII